MTRISWVITAAIVLAGPPHVWGDFQPFGVVQVNPAFEVDGAGLNVDTIAFWEAPDSSNTLMFVTAKDNSLVEVWKYPFVGNELPSLTHSTFGTSRPNGVVVDQETDLLYVTISNPADTSSVFALPSLAHEFSFGKPGVDLGGEPNCGFLELVDGQKRVFVSADVLVYVHDATDGAYVGEFPTVQGLETIVGDYYDQIVYIPDERNGTGVYAYHPDGAPFERNGTSVFGAGVFDADAEGILLYTCPAHGGADVGCGLIVVSDQRMDMTDFEVFDRESWEHLGTFRITGVANTDGIASTQRALPDYPMGLFTAIHDDMTTVGVGWDSILVATGLSCPDTTTYELVVEVVGSGSVTLSPPGGVYKVGTSVTLTATGTGGDEFTGWSGDANGTENPLAITLDGHKAITARFQNPVDAAAGARRTDAVLRATPSVFRERTRFSFAVPGAGTARLEILDVSGRRVRHLARVRVGFDPAVVSWEGHDDRGRRLPSGVYFARLTWPGGTTSTRISLVR